LLRFRLRHMLWFVAAASALLTVLVSLHGIAALAVMLAVLVISFHLLSTALGSQLRLHANRGRNCEIAGFEAAARGYDRRNDPSASFDRESAQSPWYARNGTALAGLPSLIAAAVLVGGVSGAIFLTAAIGHRTSFAGLVVGALSLAALSGLFAFLAGSLFGVVRGGFSEAAAEQERAPRGSDRC
jgi:vacuolar-type H+-ATPase subunit I/STV1